MKQGPSTPTSPRVTSRLMFKDQPLDKKWVIPQDKILRVTKKAHKMLKGVDLSSGGRIIEIKDKHSDTMSLRD